MYKPKLSFPSLLTVVLAFTLVMLIAIALAGCSTPKLESGTVVDRDFDRAWQQWVPGSTTQTCSGGYNNQPRICVPVHHPGHYIYHPDDYDLRIRGTDKEGKQIVEWHDVSADIYTTCQIGDFYEKELGCQQLR